MMRIVLVAAGLAMLAGCASGPRGPSRAAIDRMLVRAPGKAQPSKVIATELALARTARGEGERTAYSEFAAPGAVIHGRDGPVDAATWLASRADPAEAVRRNARAVWMSCDSLTAVSQGRFRTPSGIVGTYITAWELQNNGEYRWSYDVTSPDDPQPPATLASVPGDSDIPEENRIVIDALDSAQGFVGDCPRAGAGAPPPVPASVNTDPAARSGLTVARDGTLRWYWLHDADGQRRFVLDILQEGAWQTALDRPIPPVQESGSEL